MCLGRGEKNIKSKPEEEGCVLEEITGPVKESHKIKIKKRTEKTVITLPKLETLFQ